MHVGNVVVDNFCPLPCQVIFEFLHRLLVARDNRGGEESDISFFKFDRLVGSVGDAHERRILVALRAGREHHDFVIRVVLHFLCGDDGAAVHGEEPQFPGDFHICLHGASLNHDFFPHFLRVLDDKDDALQERGKGADDKPAGCFGNDFMQVDVHVTLGVREAGLLYVGGIGDEEQILFLTDSGERLHLVWLGDAILMVNLNVSGHDDISIRGVHDDPHRIGDSVRGLKESKGKMFSYAQGFPASDDLNVELGEVGEFFLPLFNHHRGEECGVDGGVPDFAHYKRDAADVVKVSVGNEHCFDRRRALFKVGGVGDNVINARCLLIRELHTNVHNHNLAAVLNGGHILADLFHAAQRNYF